MQNRLPLRLQFTWTIYLDYLPSKNCDGSDIRQQTHYVKTELSIRDILAWVNFINGVIGQTNRMEGSNIVSALSVEEAVVQGRVLV